MSIVTKKGDGGKTSLYCGKVVGKDHIRVETCGAIDEVSSFLGVAKHATKDGGIKKVLRDIQKELIILGSEVATTKKGLTKLKKKIDKNSVCALEKEIECLEDKCAVRMKSFCLPGANAASGALDVARAVTRRAERRSVTLVRKGMLNNPHVVAYLNRLSDLLYLLARSSEGKR